MSTSAATMPHGVSVGRSSDITLIFDEARYATLELWRSRIVLVFTFVLPLAWLFIIGTMVRDQVDPRSGAPVMQYVTPAAALMGIMFAAFPPVARSLAEARERHLLKRIEGAPLPVWMYLVGRIGGALVLSLASILVMFAIGSLLYDVQIIWRTLPATIVTLALAIAMFAALGLAVGSIARSATSAQTIAVAATIGVSFLSGLFTMGTSTPGWMQQIGAFFPAIHVLDTLWDQFSPALTTSGWEFDQLAPVIIWGVAGLATAAWAMRRETIYASGTTHRRRHVWTVGSLRRSRESSAAEAPIADSRPGTVTALVAERHDRPGAAALVLDQTTWTLRAAWRDIGWIAFALGMPTLLYAFMTAQYRGTFLPMYGMSFELFFACAMTVYGIGVTAFVNIPVDVARLRDQLVLKRVRGTPLAPSQLLVGRSAAILLLSLATAALILVIAVAIFGAELDVAGLAIAALVVLLGSATLAACGFALACLMPNARALAVASLAVLLPLSFFSDIFVVSDSRPEWFATVGDLFPLRHFVFALAGAVDPAGIDVRWTDVAALVIWLGVASAFAVRRWRWQPSG